MNAVLEQSDSLASPSARPRRRFLGAGPAFWIIVLLLIAVTAAIFQYFSHYAPGCNGIRQARIMRLAKKDAERIMPKLHTNPLFQNVTLDDYTMGTCGCMSARGTVADKATALQLRDQLATYHLPYEVKFYLEYADGGSSYFDPTQKVPDIPIFTPNDPQ